MTRANRIWIAAGAILLAFALPYGARGGFTQSGSAQGKVAAVAPRPPHAAAFASLGHARTLPRSVPAPPPPPPPSRPRRRARTVTRTPAVTTSPTPRFTSPAPSSPAPAVSAPTPSPSPAPAPAPAPKPAPAPQRFSSSG